MVIFVDKKIKLDRYTSFKVHIRRVDTHTKKVSKKYHHDVK